MHHGGVSGITNALQIRNPSPLIFTMAAPGVLGLAAVAADAVPATVPNAKTAAQIVFVMYVIGVSFVGVWQKYLGPLVHMQVTQLCIAVAVCNRAHPAFSIKL